MRRIRVFLAKKLPSQEFFVKKNPSPPPYIRPSELLVQTKELPLQPDNQRGSHHYSEQLSRRGLVANISCLPKRQDWQENHRQEGQAQAITNTLAEGDRQFQVHRHS